MQSTGKGWTRSSVALPRHLVKNVPKLKNIRRIRSLIGDPSIHTVCESASCPNIGECFAKNTLTFMILGDICTRNCRYCGVKHGRPMPLDSKEPERISQAAAKLGLDYVVITSVTRDDLPDGGAGQFAAVIKKLWDMNNKLRIEVLIPDFQGDAKPLRTVLAARPTVLNHNVETMPRLYSEIRPQADYQRSLKLLRQAKELQNDIYTKSGFMVGLGESRAEVFQVITDLKKSGCDIVTIGQYLAPGKGQVPVARYIRPEEYDEFQVFGQSLGLKVIAGPFVRSSYHAKDSFEDYNEIRTG
ncbi:MAG: lipoyl synthase [Candidatus Saganbacteria bacterium]|nr:lipoyl synthase [Candidatus Saganbacteria bacterium]